MKNREKFEEIFGFKPNNVSCALSAEYKCSADKSKSNNFCDGCYYDRFWDKEYTGKKIAPNGGYSDER